MGVPGCDLVPAGSEEGVPPPAQDTPSLPCVELGDIPRQPFVLVVCAGPVWEGDAEAVSQ